MRLKEKWAEFYQDPFEFMTNLKLEWGLLDLNIFHKVPRLQKTSLIFSIVCLALWLILGFDSTPLQFVHVLYEGLPAYLTGQATMQDLGAIYALYYGKEMHYSAFVIYGLMFWGLSKNFSNKGIHNAKNVAYSAGLVFLAIATFEYFWIYSFGFWQGQPWVYTWRWPQLRILLQNLAFLVCGAFTALYLILDTFILNKEKTAIIGRRYRFRFDLGAVVLIALTLSLTVLWYNYPWHVDQITVEYVDGSTWTSSRHFPQTLYTIDINPLDNDNSGVWHWVENDAIHGLNTLHKIIWTCAIMYICLIKPGGLYREFEK